MSSEELHLVVELLQEHNVIKRRQTVALEHVASVLEQILTCLMEQSSMSKTPPDCTRPLAEFPTFDWASIGAIVVQQDNYGAAIVRWGSRDYVRRSPSNKFGEAIWFSRCVGKDELGANQYERLITFKPQASAEALPQKTLSRLGH